MKINSSILAAALGLASASLASATQTVYITGSTAARDAVYNTITNAASTIFDAQPSFVGYGSSTPGSCSQMVFSNTIGGTPTLLKCAWSGSEAGITDVSGSTPKSFLADPGVNGVNPVGPGLTSSATSTGATSGQTTDSHVVDLAQADNALTYSYTPASTSTAIDDHLVIPFVFVKSATTIANQALLTDINGDNFKAIAAGGDKLGLFTGINTDTTYVYLSGRDHFSGTRANTFGVTGFGIKKTVSQVYLDSTGNMAIDPNGDGTYLTPEGQASGGTLAKSLVNTGLHTDQVNGGTGFIVVAYLGLGDAAVAEGAPYNAVELTYCGQHYSAAAVQNGQYLFWGYEFTLKRSGIGSVANTVATKLAANIGANAGGYELPESTMNVKRSGPTGYVYHK